MKRIVALLLCMCIFSGMTVFADDTTESPKKEYEIWTQSPAVTCGITTDELQIYKALNQNTLKLLPLDMVGDGYYLAVCEKKTTSGGYNGNNKTTQFYLYTLYETDTGFIVLSKATPQNEYAWDKGFSMVDISNKIDYNYYTQNNSEVPCYIVSPNSRYVNINWPEYAEYFFITSTGKLYMMSEETTYNQAGYPFIKDSILYRGQERYKSGSSYYDYLLSNNSTKASETKPMFFRNGVIYVGTAAKIAVSTMTVENGYNMYKEGFGSNVYFASYIPIAGSEKLFFKLSSVLTYNESAQKNYYYLRVDVYQSVNGKMNKTNSKLIPTKNTSAVGYTCRKVNSLDESYYINNNLMVPAVVIGTTAIITKEGEICSIGLDPSVYSSYCYPCTYNNRFAIIRSYNGNSTIYKKDPATGSNCYWQVINEVEFDSEGKAKIKEDLELKIQSEAHKGQNGYFSKSSTWNESDFTTITGDNVSLWWGRKLSRVFPDGRYVTATWTSVGSNIYELWYNVYNPDGTLRSTGPTGYSAYFSSSSSTYSLSAYAMNNSKFIVCLGEIGNGFVKEYYRAVVVEESETGEVINKVELGEKNITPPQESDTEIVQSIIDFSKTELPIGYNIKDNVVDSSKLDSSLREQVNSIILNDIVILKKNGYQGGSQNTGVKLDSYSEYDHSFGDAPVRLYTNGQYFGWQCNNTELLTPGTYSQTIMVGEKTIHVTFKVVKVPTSDGATMVVF